MADLSSLAGSLEVPATTDQRRERVRTILTSSAAPARHRSFWPIGAVAATAATLLIAAVASFERSVPAQIANVAPPEVAQPILRGRIIAHDGARYWTAREQPDEIVRLVEGTLTVDVDHLQRGERFRVITGDGEVEVRGTTFDVSARGDRIRHLRVLRGVVDLRRAESPPATLRDGERWQLHPKLEPPSPARPVARRAATRAPPPAPREDRITYESAWSALRDGNFQSAAEGFRRARGASADPALREDSAYFLGVSLARAGDKNGAIETLDAFLGDYPESSRAGEVAAVLGWMFYERGESARAAELFDRAVNEGSDKAAKSGADGLEALRRDRARESQGRE